MNEHTWNRSDTLKLGTFLAGTLTAVGLSACEGSTTAEQGHYDWLLPDCLYNPDLIDFKDIDILSEIIAQAPSCIEQQAKTTDTLLNTITVNQNWPELTKQWDQSSKYALASLRLLKQTFSDFKSSPVEKDIVLSDYQEIASYLWYVAVSVKNAQDNPDQVKFIDLVADVPGNTDPLLENNALLAKHCSGRQWNTRTHYEQQYDTGARKTSLLLDDILAGGKQMHSFHEITNFPRPDYEMSTTISERDGTGMLPSLIVENNGSVPVEAFSQIQKTILEVTQALGLTQLVKAFQFSVVEGQSGGEYTEISDSNPQLRRSVQIYFPSEAETIAYAGNLFRKIQHAVHESIHAFEDLYFTYLPQNQESAGNRLKTYYTRQAQRSQLLEKFDTTTTLTSLFGLPVASDPNYHTERDVSMKSLTAYPIEYAGPEYNNNSLGIVEDIYRQLGTLENDWSSLFKPLQETPINRLLIPQNPVIDPQKPYAKEDLSSYLKMVILPQITEQPQSISPLLPIETLFVAKLQEFIAQFDQNTFSDPFILPENTPQTLDSYVRNIISPTIFYQMLTHDTQKVLDSVGDTATQPHIYMTKNRLERLANEFKQKRTRYHHELFAQTIAFALKTQLPDQGGDGLPLFRVTDPNPQFSAILDDAVKLFTSTNNS